jgi:hypothetical protein
MYQQDMNVSPASVETFRLLSLLSTQALVRLKTGKINLIESTRNLYMGRWERVELDKSQFAQIASQETLAPMSIEIISALSDMSDHIHYHENSYALLTILGSEEGYEEPKNCKMFFKGVDAVAARSGITLQVPPGATHSFSSGDTPLTFLSVQSRKIDADYHYAE